MYHNIILAVDGSDHALKAAQTAGELARLTKGNLWVMTAYEAIPDYLGEPNLQNVVEERMDRAKEVLKQAIEQVGQIPGQIESDALEGPPAEAILRAVEARNADLIVMGSRGLGRITGLLLGSQSQKVVSLANCPVLLVR